MRSFWSVESVLCGDAEDLAVTLNALGTAELRNQSVYLHDVAERVESLDRCHEVLDQLLAAVEGVPDGQIALDFTTLDAVLAGFENGNRDTDRPVHLLLALVNLPPRWIIEAPSDATLAYLGRPYTFATLWDRYVRFNQQLHRVIISRYAGRPLTGLTAIEFGNEPDYMWTPEEMKIEWGGPQQVYPLSKYVTELHLPQVPETQQATPAFEKTAWGYQDQDAAWATESSSGSIVPVLDFDWGRKFDWYVKCFADLHAHVAWAIKDEAHRCGVEITTVSGSVTHNNIDYLLRMHRANPRAFEYIDKIGIHPYHWFNNNVWDDHFVRGNIGEWTSVGPRRFASEVFKRFDFLTVFGGDSGDPAIDAEIKAAFGDRKLWVTEFGIGSKIIGQFTAPIAEYTKFIRPRTIVGGTAGYTDVVWDDMWTAFVDQVDGDWLRAHGVECLLLYALRELGIPGFDLDDDDRSNFALLHRDGSPRLDADVLDRVVALVSDMTGSSLEGHRDARRACLRPSAEIYRRPWRQVEISDSIRDVLTMLSTEERQLLYWLTSSYWTGAGAIVDGGCFVGGSTVALAEGLRAAGASGQVDVYDLFEVEPYMTDFYFRHDDLGAGDSFRHIFDRNTKHVHDLIRVHPGDLTRAGWDGRPIEILFIDFAKAWSLNDYIVETFFPCLLPGRSLVVQQDFIFAGCPWIALTMEYLEDYFQPVALAEYCSVVYFCEREIPHDLPRVSELPHETRIQLMDRAAGRFRGYPRDVLECAKATLLVENGDIDAAHAILARIEQSGAAHHVTREAIELVTRLASPPMHDASSPHSKAAAPPD